MREEFLKFRFDFLYFLFAASRPGDRRQCSRALTFGERHVGNSRRSCLFSFRFLAGPPCEPLLRRSLLAMLRFPRNFSSRVVWSCRSVNTQAADKRCHDDKMSAACFFFSFCKAFCFEKKINQCVIGVSEVARCAIVNTLFVASTAAALILHSLPLCLSAPRALRRYKEAFRDAKICEAAGRTRRIRISAVSGRILGSRLKVDRDWTGINSDLDWGSVKIDLSNFDGKSNELDF